MARKKNKNAIKLIRFGFMALIIALVFSVVFNNLSDTTYAFEVQDNGYGLQVSSEKIGANDNKKMLFNIENMAPGDEYAEIVTVKNSGSESFQSIITAMDTSTQGKLLFETLEFEIREGNENGTVIYDGKLKDMKDITLCSLSKNNKKVYYMLLSLPTGAGNEYQNQNANFKFIITADAK